MKAVIKNKKEIAKDTLCVTFDLLGKEVNFKPGQYFFITIPKLNYDDPRGNIRHFSIVNSPLEKGIIKMATRLREQSGFKKTLRELDKGSEVTIGSVTGDFTLPKDENKELIFIAGGIGITPFISMLNYINQKKLSTKVTLIYSNRNKESTPFFDELKKLEKKNKNIKIIFIMTQDENWKGEKRRIDKELIEDYVKNFENCTFYVAGPPSLNDAVLKTLKELGVKNIVRENFSGY